MLQLAPYYTRSTTTMQEHFIDAYCILFVKPDNQ